MEDVPQPATDPYSAGDVVMVYPAEDDPDGHQHEAGGVVAEILEDSLGTETGRGMDSLSYRIEIDGYEQFPRRSALSKDDRPRVCIFSNEVVPMRLLSWVDS